MVGTYSSNAAIVGILALVLICCAPSQGERPLSQAFWRGNGTQDAKAALARGDSQYIMLHLPDSSRVFLDSAWGNIELDLNAIRHVTAADLGFDRAYLAAHGDSITTYLHDYNGRMVKVRIMQAMCEPGDQDTFCLDAAS